MSLIKYPYTNLHELNLDWIIEQLNNQDGPVRSVNGKTGIVTLTGEDIVRSSSNPESVSAALATQGTSIQTVRNQIGVTPLPTTAQTLTGAIAENAQEIADVEDNVIGSTELPTEAQTLTGAIAENADNIGGNAESITTINNKIGSTALPTTAQTLTGAIAENAGSVTTLSNQLTNTNVNDCATVVDAGDAFAARRVGNMLIIDFIGANRTHAEDELLFTLASGYRPAARTKAIGSISATPVVIDIATDGKCIIYVINGATSSARLYFHVAIAI